MRPRLPHAGWAMVALRVLGSTSLMLAVSAPAATPPDRPALLVAPPFEDRPCASWSTVTASPSRMAAMPTHAFLSAVPELVLPSSAAWAGGAPAPTAGADVLEKK